MQKETFIRTLTNVGKWASGHDVPHSLENEMDLVAVVVVEIGGV